MTSLSFALYLTFLCLWRRALTAKITLSLPVHQESGFVSASVGDSVTLRCFYAGNVASMFYWYKQPLGQKPRLISSFFKHDESGTFYDEFEVNPRFTLEAKKGENHLTISNLCVSDTATYYCVSAYAYNFEFAEGTILHVKRSDLNIPALVHQSVSETIQPGGSVTLDCTVHTGTCDGEHSVYWFRSSEESHPGLIYTHGDRNDECVRKDNTQPHTCVYELPMKSLNHSHVGIYYCAVASCGHILFGNGTRLKIEDNMNSPETLVSVLSGALTFSTIMVVLLTVSVYRLNKTTCQCAESQRVSASTTTNAEPDQDAGNLHYAALRGHKAKRSRRQRDDTQTECVYSSVRQ